MRVSFKCPGLENVLLMFFLLIPILRSAIFMHIPNGYAIMDITIVLLIFASALKNRSYISEYNDILVFYTIIVFLFLIKFICDPSMRVWISRDYGIRSMLLTGGVFGYGVIRVQKHYDKMIVTMKHAGIILSIYYLVQSFEVIRNGYWSYTRFGNFIVSSTNMSWSYGVLLAISLLSIYVVIDKKLLYIIPILFGFWGILIYGSRGTAIAFIIGFFLEVLLVNDGKLKATTVLLIVLSAVLILFLFSDAGINYVASWLDSHGLNSRFIDLIYSKENIENASNGRTRIWLNSIEMIKSGPIWGYGVMGERNRLYSLGYKWGYCHNLFLEVLIMFGWIIGGILIVLFFAGIVRLFKSSNDRIERLAFVIFLTSTIELFVSNSLWLHYGVWCLLAMYVNHFRIAGGD